MLRKSYCKNYKCYSKITNVPILLLCSGIDLRLGKPWFKIGMVKDRIHCFEENRDTEGRGVRCVGVRIVVLEKDPYDPSNILFYLTFVIRVTVHLQLLIVMTLNRLFKG